ncbi:MAG: glucose-6-phosphate isomerase [Alphaproteobacteria bacterium]|nr:glucose-6-phosphate isomerase [Alphaproteobacteria bacterium]
MLYEQDLSGCLARRLGAHGLTDDDLLPEILHLEGGITALRAQHERKSLPLLALPGRSDDLAPLAPLAEEFRSRFDHVVVLGTGGSSLGGQTLVALKDLGIGKPQGAPKLIFLDNIDPEAFAALSATVDWRRAGLIVISKSGTTAETLTQLLTLLPKLKVAQGAAHGRHVVVITEPGDNPMRRIAATIGARILDHDPGIGGRYSVLSLVGLLPALIAGVDVAEVRRGALEVLDDTLTRGTASAPAQGAVTAITLARKRGASVTVIMPYLDRLAQFGLWYRQLWAESLGKGGKGTTPIRAMGTVDQHSQLQLYLGGPRDKTFTLIETATVGTGDAVPEASARAAGIDYLAGRRMGDLLAAEARATADTLLKGGRPTRVIRLAKLNAASMGALLMHFMLETILAAHLLGVDPFDQPAVEEGKILARRYLAEMTRS